MAYSGVMWCGITQIELCKVVLSSVTFVRLKQATLVQSAARLLADLNLAPSALRWWEKGGVGIIGKGTS